MASDRLVLVVAVAAMLVVGVVAVAELTSRNPVTSTAPPSNLRFTFFSFDSQLIQTYGRAGDFILMVPTSSVSTGCGGYDLGLISSMKSQFPTLLTIVTYDSLSSMRSCVGSLPSSVDYIGYDFEPGLCPEFTTNQTVASQLFDQAYGVAHKSGMKLIIAPAYHPIQSLWNWGEVARHADALNVQLQSLTNDTQLYQSVTDQIAGQVAKSSPNTILLVQMSLLRATVQEDIQLYNAVASSGINGIVLYHSTAQSSLVQSFLQQIR